MSNEKTEVVSSSLHGFHIERLFVPGGWLIITRRFGAEYIAQTFISDPTHEWDLDED